MIIPTYEQAKQYEKDYTYIPVCREILADDVTPILMLRKLAALDDAEHQPQIPVYKFLARVRISF